MSLPAAGATAAATPLGKFLKVSLHFTKTRYAPGDRAHVVVVLRNTGTAPLRHLGAACNRIDEPDELTNKGRGWGALAVGAAGVTLAPRSTRTLHVTATVPAAAQRYGDVAAQCDFGYVGVDSGYRPVADDEAKVPGQFGVVAGEVSYFVHGHSGATAGLKNVRVVLVDPTTCPVFTRTAKTDARGRFRIAHAPAGSAYEVYAYPPHGWKVLYQNPTRAQVLGKSTARLVLEVERGTGRKPRPPTSCS